MTSYVFDYGKFLSSKESLSKDNSKNKHQDYSEEFEKITGIPNNIVKLNQISKIQLSSNDGIIISKYYNNTICHPVNIKISSVWSVKRQDHEANFVKRQFNKEKRYLLCHGTKMSNLKLIMENGFKLPEYSAKGLMFGKGVYFADRSSKSVQYCDLKGNEVLLLCEVALGNKFKTGFPKDYDRVTKYFNSIKGIGKHIPDKSDKAILDNGVIVPYGPTVKNGQPKIEQSHLNFNEYVVFDPDRIIIRFVIIFTRK